MSNEVAKALGVCRQLIKNLKLDLSQYMKTNDEGNTEFNFAFPLPDGTEALISIIILSSRMKTIHDKIFIRSEVASMENVPALNTEGFLKALLKLNAEVDTAWAGITEEKIVIAKAERMIRGMDVDELTDMTAMVAKLAIKIKNELCVIYGIKPLVPGSIAPKPKVDSEIKEKLATYVEILNGIQTKVLGVEKSCEELLKAKDIAGCNKLYFKESYEILEEIKTKAPDNTMLHTVRDEVAKAISDSEFLKNEQSRYNMFKGVFEKVIKEKG